MQRSSLSIWWHNPKLRTDAERDSDRKATWLELFFDLVFVAAIATLAHNLSHDMEAHPSWHVLVTYLFLFIPVWWVWIGNTFYNERFETNDIGHRIATLIQMAGVAGLAYFAHEGLDAQATRGFAFMYAFCRIVLIALWWRGAAYNPAARPMVRFITSGFAASVVLFMVSMFVEPPLRFVLWGIGLFLDMFVPFVSLPTQRHLPRMSLEHLRERFGLFTIIVLGESVAGAVYGAANAQELDLRTTLSGLLGLVLSFSLWFMYFDQVMNARMGKSRVKLSIWFYAHLPLMMALTAVGAGVLAVTDSSGIRLSQAVSWLLGGATALTFLAFAFLEYLSEGWVDDMGKPTAFFAVRVLAAAAALGVGYAGPSLDAVAALGLLLALSLVQVIIGMYFWVQAVKAHGDDYRHGWVTEA